MEAVPSIPIINSTMNFDSLSIGVKRAILFHKLTTTYLREFLSTLSRVRLVKRERQEEKTVARGAEDRVLWILPYQGRHNFF